MILLKRVKIHNLFSHADTDISFKQDEKLLIDGKSGSGKSSILEALLWNLYGVARVDNRSLVRRGEKNAAVIVELESDSKKYRIERKTTDKAKNSLVVLESSDGKNFQAIERTGMKDMQDWIEGELLHASYELFVNSVAYPQDNIKSFVRQPASKRKDLLLEIVKTVDFDTNYAKAKSQIDVITLESEVLKSTKTSAENTIRDSASIIEKIPELEKKLNDSNISIASARDSVNSLITFISTFESISTQLTTKRGIVDRAITTNIRRQNDIQRLKNAIETNSMIDIKSAREKLVLRDELVKEFNTLDEKLKKAVESQNTYNKLFADRPQIYDYDYDIDRLNKQLIPLIKDSGRCPAGDKCPFIGPIKNQISFFEGQIKEKEEAKTRQDKAIKDFQEKMSAVKKEEILPEDQIRHAQLANNINSLSAFESVVTKYESAMEMNKEMQKSIDTMTSDMAVDTVLIDTTKKEINELMGQIASYDMGGVRERYIKEKQALGVLESSHTLLLREHESALISKKASEGAVLKIEQINKALRRYAEKLECLNLIKEAFSQKGIKAVLVDYLIPSLEERVNDILSQMSDFKVRFNTQRSTVSGESVVEGLFIEIFNDRGELHDLDAYSGGERLRITVAIAEALATLQKVGFRIFDEAFLALDHESLDGFSAVMDRLQGRFRQIICVSHLQSIKDMFEKKIVVTKRDGISVVNT